MLRQMPFANQSVVAMLANRDNSSCYWLTRTGLYLEEKGDEPQCVAGDEDGGFQNVDDLHSLLNDARAMVFDPTELLIYIIANGSLRVYDSVTRMLTTVASGKGYVDGAGIVARFNDPHGIALDPRSGSSGAETAPLLPLRG